MPAYIQYWKAIGFDSPMLTSLCQRITNIGKPLALIPGNNLCCGDSRRNNVSQHENSSIATAQPRCGNSHSVAEVSAAKALRQLCRSTVDCLMLATVTEALLLPSKICAVLMLLNIAEKTSAAVGETLSRNTSSTNNVTFDVAVASGPLIPKCCGNVTFCFRKTKLTNSYRNS